MGNNAMRPLELALTGFRSYPTPVIVDFTGARLAAALGDTGAGKSSLLDAIAFALFRKSSWDAKESRQLIADGAQAMSVELTFLHDGQRWRVHRTMHATNPNAGRHHLTNLDTGEEVDGATAVDARIKAVLQMSYDTFLRVGLLPQGKFDRLLTAAPKERSALLRELFGAESLEVMQQMATRHCLRLTGLLGEAKAKRATMPDDPAEIAAAAGEAADVAAASADRLNTAIDNITALQGQVSTARAAVVAATTATHALATRSVSDATTVLGNLEPVAADITRRRLALDDRAAALAAQEHDLTVRIEDTEASGEGADALGKATVILENLGARAQDHRGERDRIAALTERLAADGEAIVAAKADLAARAEQARPLTAAADAAADMTKRVRTRATTVRSRIAAATTAALHVAKTSRDHSAALEDLDAARGAVVRREEEAAIADAGLTSAEARLDALQLRDRAAAMAAELHPGDNCPVCRQHVPVDFEPASTTHAAELRGAKKRLRDTKVARDNTSGTLAQARATVTMAEDAVSLRAEDRHAAQQEARDVTDAAARVLANFALLAVEAQGSFDAEAASANLIAATAILAAPPEDSATNLEQLTEPIATALTACEHAAADRAEQLRTEALRHTAVVDAERNALTDRTTEHQNAVQDANAASSRHARAVARTVADVRTLPVRIQTMLPDDAIDISVGAAAAAAAAVATRRAEVQDLLDRREAVRTETTKVLTQQRALDQESRTAVEGPLNKLRGALNTWADAAAQAITYLGTTTECKVPEAPADPEITEIRVFVSQLSTAATTLHSELTEACATQSDCAEAACTRLREQAAALADIDGFDPDADLTAPNILHPLVAASTTAITEANRQRTAQRTAQDQVQPAADLDFAICAGEARREALDVLHRELVDAKFLGHLTGLNTRALLGIASDLLGQLTDWRFGFADSFEIVSRGSGVVHSPNRLSGGEKFLASLALALALAELHSRSGPRLGSLFLDEGFAALDAATLESALEVLRIQAGGDRLVMVISHLHAVAEAVDDVLWVQRSPAGSTARWLTPTERDELVHADLASGLQALA